MAKTYGIDISHYQNEKGKISWDKVKRAGFDFVFIKATESTNYLDPYLKANQADIRNAGLVLGYYHFARAGDYKKEADWFLKNVGEIKKGELLALDFELKTIPDPAEWCSNWLDYVKSKVGFKPLLYTYHDILKLYDWRRVSDGNFGLWAARYGLQEQVPNEKYAPTSATFPFVAIWQYCSKGIVNGIIGNVDLNSTTMTMEELLKYGKPDVGFYPSDILDLKNWKLTLPVGKPTEVLQPELDTFIYPGLFYAEKSGVVFTASVKGATTSGSGYPRSELREMNGTKLASWDTAKGKHSMKIDQAVLAVPKKKKHIVVGQIHDSEDDIIVIRLEDKKLFVDVGGTSAKVLVDNYKLGDRFDIEFVAENGKIKIYYESVLVYTLNKAVSGCYFKAGAYTQSNCSKEDVCSDDNYGSAIIYALKVTHTESETLPPATPSTKGKVVSRKQGDPRWGNVKIGNSTTNLTKNGCLVTVISDALHWLGVDLLPDYLAQNLSFTSDGLLYWNSITEKTRGKFVTRQRVFDKVAIDTALKHPTQCVFLEFNFAGVRHWCWALGKDVLGRYKICDPLQGDFTTSSRYGTIVGFSIIDLK